jgi:Holliday junction resolvase RusA-like endonuclease
MQTLIKEELKTNNITSFIIPGNPQGKARARTFYNKNANKVCSMTPDNTALYENLIKIAFMTSKVRYLEGPIELIVEAYFSIPDSYSKKKKEQCIK